MYVREENSELLYAEVTRETTILKFQKGRWVLRHIVENVNEKILNEQHQMEKNVSGRNKIKGHFLKRK